MDGGGRRFVLGDPSVGGTNSLTYIMDSDQIQGVPWKEKKVT
jgi:hypothetical protein